MNAQASNTFAALLPIYIEREISLVDIPARSKAPTGADWINRGITNIDQAIKIFGAGERNVGAILGHRSGGIVDIDLDCPEAIELSDEFLPITGAVFGRASAPTSHRIYRARGAAKTRRWVDPLFSLADAGKAVILELRSDGAQTVFPPSIHPSGERIEWSSLEDFSEASFNDLLAGAARLAVEVMHQRYGERAFSHATVQKWIVEGQSEHHPKAGRRQPNEKTLKQDAPNERGRERAYALKILRNESNTLAAMVKGGRNSALNIAALKLGHHVAAGRLSRREVWISLKESCVKNGLISDGGMTEFTATFDSGFKAGMAQPAPPLKDFDNRKPNKVASSKDSDNWTEHAANQRQRNYSRNNDEEILDDQDEGSDPELGPEDADEFRIWFVNQTTLDAGFPFKPKIIRRLCGIYESDYEEWERIARALKDAKYLIKSRIEKQFSDIIRKRQEQEKTDRQREARQQQERAKANALPGSWGIYRLTYEGLIADVTRGHGDNAYIDEVWISSHFRIVGLTRDPRSRSWGKQLRWRDIDGALHSATVTDADLQGDTAPLTARLASDGLRINRNTQRHFATFLAAVQVDPRVRTVDSTGWHTIDTKDVFVLPDATLGVNDDAVIFTGDISASNYSSAGTLEGWKTTVAEMADGQTMAIIAISAALAGPLLSLAGMTGAGVNFVGSSSKGKSSIQFLAASVWGRPDEKCGGYIRSWRATANGLEGVAQAATDTCLILDEVAQVSAAEFASCVYMLNNGSGKARADRTGGLRDPKSWRTFVISSGELTVAQKAGEDRFRKAMAGQSVRLIDIDAVKDDVRGVFDSPGRFETTGDLVRALKRAVGENYGTAGPEFVRRLITSEIARDDIAELLNSFRAEALATKADGQVERALTVFALIAAAGELAGVLGITPWPPGTAKAAAMVCFNDWVYRRGGVSAAEVNESISRVRLIIEMHGESRFDPSDGGAKYPARDRLGWRHNSERGREWWIAPECWRAEVCAGLEPIRVAETLATRGILRVQSNSGSRFQCKVKVEGQLRRAFVVTEQIFAGGEQ